MAHIVDMEVNMNIWFFTN